jgi:hypothetical protein
MALGAGGRRRGSSHGVLKLPRTSDHAAGPGLAGHRAMAEMGWAGGWRCDTVHAGREPLVTVTVFASTRCLQGVSNVRAG